MKEVPPETINLLIKIGESPDNDSAIINLLRPINIATIGKKSLRIWQQLN